jgi:hypothetical protein
LVFQQLFRFLKRCSLVTVEHGLPSSIKNF